MKIKFNQDSGNELVKVDDRYVHALDKSNRTIERTLRARGVAIVEDFSASYHSTAEITADDLAAIHAAVQQADASFVRPVCQSTHTQE